MKTVRKVTYRTYSTQRSIGAQQISYAPAIILAGKWLTKHYGISVGDKVEIEFAPDAIRIVKKPSRV
jgi:hypothetical protein